jgi:hypothetical protein
LLGHIRAALMSRKRISTGAMLIVSAIAAGALAAGPFAEPAGAQITAPAPPPAPGLARVWFLRQFQPSESLRMPMIFINGAPFASSVPGTAFYRDFAPGTYTFSVETCTEDFNQAAALNLTAGSETDIEIQSLSSFHSWTCPSDETFYARVIPPAWAQRYLPQLSYLGPR